MAYKQRNYRYTVSERAAQIRSYLEKVKAIADELHARGVNVHVAETAVHLHGLNAEIERREGF